MTDRRAAVREAYDDIGYGYADRRDDEPPELPLLAELLDRVPDGARVLDAGCGPGTPIARALAERVDVLGVDVSREQLRVATEAVPAGRFLQGDMTRLPLATGSAAGVVAMHSVIHVPTEKHERVLGEFARVLSPGGALLLSSGTAAFEGTNQDWLGDGVPMHWSYPDPTETEAMLGEAGFTVVETWTVGDGFADAGEKWVALAAAGTDHGGSATTKRGSRQAGLDG
ncbi:MAG: class I SAM-dependent methyltransferase [Halanaeroarchaeum sp.]